MEAQATAKYVRMSPRKVRLVVDLVRGLPVAKATHALSVLNKKAAQPVAKVLQSAAANAVHNFEANEKDLFVKFITADEGPTLKRWQPRAFGRATMIRKRTTHITVVVSDGKDTVAKSVVKKDTKKTKEVTKQEGVHDAKAQAKKPIAKQQTKKASSVNKASTKKPATPIQRKAS